MFVKRVSQTRTRHVASVGFEPQFLGLELSIGPEIWAWLCTGLEWANSKNLIVANPSRLLSMLRAGTYQLSLAMVSW